VVVVVAVIDSVVGWNQWWWRQTDFLISAGRRGQHNASITFVPGHFGCCRQPELIIVLRSTNTYMMNDAFFTSMPSLAMFYGGWVVSVTIAAVVDDDVGIHDVAGGAGSGSRFVVVNTEGWYVCFGRLFCDYCGEI
jgi:hypothetical protein